MLVEIEGTFAPAVARIVQLALAAGLAVVLLAATSPLTLAADPATPQRDTALEPARKAARERRDTAAPADNRSAVVVTVSTLDPKSLVPAQFADWETDQRR